MLNVIIFALVMVLALPLPIDIGIGQPNSTTVSEFSPSMTNRSGVSWEDSLIYKGLQLLDRFIGTRNQSPQVVIVPKVDTLPKLPVATKTDSLYCERIRHSIERMASDSIRIPSLTRVMELWDLESLLDSFLIRPAPELKHRIKVTIDSLDLLDTALTSDSAAI